MKEEISVCITLFLEENVIIAKEKQINIKIVTI